MIKNTVFAALALLTVGFLVAWYRAARRSSDTPDRGAPNAERVAVGFFANFFDALGIGSFATTTTYFRLRKMVRDELIPGTLNVGYCLPTVTQAFIGIAVIAVEPTTLVLMIAAAVAGAWIGAGIVSRLPRRAIQIGMGVALLVAAAFMFAKVTRLMPADEVKVGAQGVELRSAASATAPAVATLNLATPLELVRAGHEWSEVKVQGSETRGFVPQAATTGVVLGSFAMNLAVGPAGALLRSATSEAAPMVAPLPPGTELELVGTSGGWLQVSVADSGTRGYVQTAKASGIVLGVTGIRLAAGLVGSFFLGLIMPLGIGYYAPCMVLIALLGMTPTAAFPIMMGACAFLMPVASAEFVRKRKYSLRTALGMALGGIFGSALALLVVKSLPLYWVMWLVTFVIIYTGISLLRAAARERQTAGRLP